MAPTFWKLHFLCQRDPRADYKLPKSGLTEMARQVAVVFYVVAMVAVIVGVDFVFLRNRFWERLTVNRHCLGVRSFLLFLLEIF
jgi:hypothetical protein